MNKAILIGRLTKEPELRYTSTNNTAVCSFTVAVNRRFKKDEADFINCQAWSKTAEFVSQYFHKGDAIAIVGRIQTRTWGDNEGKKHYATEVVVEEVNFAGSRKSSESVSDSQADNQFYQSYDDDELPFK